MVPPSIVVLADFLDRYELDALASDHIDRPIASAQSDRALAGASTPEWFVVVAGHLSHVVESIGFNRSDPNHQVNDDMAWEAPKLFLGGPGQFD
jgi:hypothetical protein